VNPIRTTGRLVRILAASVTAALAYAAAVPAAHAVQRPGWVKNPPLPAPIHSAVASGMPVWQIALIAAAAALVTAALAVTAYRVRATRRPVTVGDNG
jgi:hypothetical protein